LRYNYDRIKGYCIAIEVGLLNIDSKINLLISKQKFDTWYTNNLESKSYMI